MRLAWLDCETTGLSPRRNGIIQLAFLIEDNRGKVVDKLNLRILPFDGCVYDKKALMINGKTEDEIKNFTPEKEAFKEMIVFLRKNGVHEKALLQPSGYNSAFDTKFLQELFRRNSDIFNFYGKFFSYYDVDTYALVKILDLEGELDGKVCKKLGAICDTMGVKFKGKAHDALVDIIATRKLHNKIVKKYLK